MPRDLTFINAVKSAKNFGLIQGGKQTLAGLLVWITDVDSMGLETAQGLFLSNGFYWDATKRRGNSPSASSPR